MRDRRLSDPAPPRRREREFADNRLLPLLFGPHNAHLARIEQRLGVAIANRGNQVVVTGPEAAVDDAMAALDAVWQQLRAGAEIGPGDIDGAIQMVEAAPALAPPLAPSINREIRTRRAVIRARTALQARYLDAMDRHELVFGLGPAGTGKTYLAVAQAVSMLLARQVDRIVLSRPAVEAGERLGFLPGDMQEKVNPYLRPILDALRDMLPPEQLAKRIETGEIEIAPLAFMRGRTLAHAFFILDEAQNTTPTQMKMALTRLGEGSRCVVTGDLTQVDLPAGQRSGLAEAVTVLADEADIAMVRFSAADVVRHRLVATILNAYDRHDATRR